MNVRYLLKRVYQKSWTLDAWSGRLASVRLGAWTLDDWTLPLWTLGLWTTGRFHSGSLDSGHLDPGNSFHFLLTSISFFLLFNVEFLNISNAPQLMYYGSIIIQIPQRDKNLVLKVMFHEEKHKQLDRKLFKQMRNFFQNRGHIF